MSALEEIFERYEDDLFLVADGYDNAVIGVDESGMKLIYSVTMCIEALVNEQGMDYEEAVDFFNYNTLRANDYMGERAPIFCHD